jgi:hypothetical protein
MSVLGGGNNNVTSRGFGDYYYYNTYRHSWEEWYDVWKEV